MPGKPRAFTHPEITDDRATKQPVSSLSPGTFQNMPSGRCWVPCRTEMMGAQYVTAINSLFLRSAY